MNLPQMAYLHKGHSVQEGRGGAPTTERGTIQLINIPATGRVNIAIGLGEGEVKEGGGEVEEDGEVELEEEEDGEVEVEEDGEVEVEEGGGEEVEVAVAPLIHNSHLMKILGHNLTNKREKGG